jgi:anti-sigma regulatory factor (Ser/Thr protein kinase)
MIGFSADRIEDVKTVVAEAVINAMQHGYYGFQRGNASYCGDGQRSRHLGVTAQAGH